jgi:hypothetical protein
MREAIHCRPLLVFFSNNSFLNPVPEYQREHDYECDESEPMVVMTKPAASPSPMAPSKQEFERQCDQAEDRTKDATHDPERSTEYSCRHSEQSAEEPYPNRKSYDHDDREKYCLGTRGAVACHDRCRFVVLYQ